MKLNYLALWAFAIPIFAESAVPVTTGTIYINARIVTAPCLPDISLKLNESTLIAATYSVKMHFSHCSKPIQKQAWAPFTLKLGNNQYVLTQPRRNNTILFSIPASNKMQRVEINYD
ncbi:hypothetical protein IMQ36_04110 [Providencia rettgeri]|nr:hypothetical protein [Providencia rettgeri]QPE18338.1 hypothetical protein IMQ36_04110 [Providencia rettgeri]